MPEQTATAMASPNIALIKYWGNTDDDLRLPVSPSISFNLAELHTRTTVHWLPELGADEVLINGAPTDEAARARVSVHLDLVRALGKHSGCARVESVNNFPIGTGIASSASAFAALSLAATAALGITLPEAALSALARRGSGSAARSIPGGFVAWHTADDQRDSFAHSFAPADHWDLVDVVAVVSREHKKTGSTAGHAVAATSPLQQARIDSAPARFEQCKNAILARDFDALAEIVELDSNVMHSVMMTGSPSLLYWQPETIAIMQQVRHWRQHDGLDVCYTIDAGPNVHCICTAQSADAISDGLAQLPGVLETRKATPGGPAQLLTT